MKIFITGTFASLSERGEKQADETRTSVHRGDIGRGDGGGGFEEGRSTSLR